MLFDVPALERERAGLTSAMADPDLWNDQDKARSVGRKAGGIDRILKAVRGLEETLGDLQAAVDLAGGEDAGGVGDAEAGLVEEGLTLLRRAGQAIDSLETTTFLAGPYDDRSAIVTLHAGAGGTEAQDWVDMLGRMFTRWAEGEDFKCQILDRLDGEEAGLKSLTLLLEGPYAYGLALSEHGVHRLVRISPFDSSGRRHTSFASVDVIPDVEEAGEIEIDSDDLRIDTFRASGAGGQHVNKTESAIRLTHLPSGIVVSCQNERSQHANREVAMRVLRSRLAKLQEEERQKKLDALRGIQGEIAWGNQIRSYVFQPYTLVKDHRTGLEIGDAGRVIDGWLDPFIKAFLRRKNDLARRGPQPGDKTTGGGNPDSRRE
jgi:peptide chain release factor 2